MRAIALMCAATVFFAALDTSAKSLSGLLPAVEIVWARYVASAIVGIVAVRPVDASHCSPRQTSAAADRPFAVVAGSTTTNFLALRHLQLAELRRSISSRRCSSCCWPGRCSANGPEAPAVAVAIGFIGVVVATGPGTNAFQPIVLVAIARRRLQRAAMRCDPHAGELDFRRRR